AYGHRIDARWIGFNPWLGVSPSDPGPSFAGRRQGCPPPGAVLLSPYLLRYPAAVADRVAGALNSNLRKINAGAMLRLQRGGSLTHRSGPGLWTQGPRVELYGLASLASGLGTRMPENVRDEPQELLRFVSDEHHQLLVAR